MPGPFPTKSVVLIPADGTDGITPQAEAMRVNIPQGTVQKSWGTDASGLAVQGETVDSTARGLAAGATQNSLVSVFKFLTAAQIADVQAGTASIDLTAALQSAVSSGEALTLPTGTYRLDGEVVLPGTIPVVIVGQGAKTIIKAGSAMTQLLRKPTFAQGGNISPVFIEDMRFDCARLADKALWLPVGKKGCLSNLIIDNFMVEMFKGGDDTLDPTARYYENTISHIVGDGGRTYATTVGTMPLYGINLTENATDNTLIDIPVGYVSEAAARIMGGGNRSFNIHGYGDNSTDTGPKYCIIAGAFGHHDAVYADNVTVAGVKITNDDIVIGSIQAYWAADNIPAGGGAVPVEINAGINRVQIGLISIRNGNSTNPAVRYLGTFWARGWSIGQVVGDHTPQTTTPNAAAAAVLPRSLAVVGQSGVEASVAVESQATSVNAGYYWYVNSKARYRVRTNATSEAGSNAGSNLLAEFAADNGTSWTTIYLHYRSSNQFDWTARHKFNDRVGFYGTNPVAQPTGTPADATDLATALTLVNSLKAKLISLGLIA